MKKYMAFLASCVFLCIIDVDVFAAQAQTRVGTVEYMEGKALLVRAGAESELDLGLGLFNQDLIKTEKDGYVVVKMDSSSGMSGTITVRPNTVCAISSLVVEGSPATEANALVGSVAVKVKKLSGNPRFSVRSGSTVMGVRGTEFVVTFSINMAILVSCSEGRVECQAELGGGIDSLDAIPGQVVEQREGQRLKSIPVALSTLESYHETWGRQELEAFKGAPLVALEQYAKTYERHRAAFLKASQALRDLPALASWRAEEAKGLVPYERDIQVMKQKSSLIPKLMAVRQVLFFFEPAYYRLKQIREYTQVPYANRKLASGKTVKNFYQEFDRDIRSLELLASNYRQALYLYAQRNGGEDPFAAFDSSSSLFSDTNDEDFFAGDDFF